MLSVLELLRSYKDVHFITFSSFASGDEKD